jgi:hypothetical protein
MNLVGHELTHTLQARESGLPLFLIKYLYQWAKSGFDYPNFPFEQAAFANGDAVEAFLRAHPEMLQTIQSGGSVSISQSSSQWSGITSISGGPFEGALALDDAVEILELVHIGGTDLRNHESMRALASLADTSSDPEIRARAKDAFEKIKTHKPGELLRRPRISGLQPF